MSLSGSLAEARQLYAALGDIEKKLADVNKLLGATSAEEAAPKAEELSLSLFELYLVSRRLGTVMRGLGLGAGIEAWTEMITRFMYLVQMLNLTIAAMEAAAGPVGWLKAGVRVLGMVSATSQALAIRRPRY